jgi:hypothetical protein
LFRDDSRAMPNRQSLWLRRSQAGYVHSVLALNPVILDVRSEKGGRPATSAGRPRLGAPPIEYDDLCRIAAGVGAVAVNASRKTTRGRLLRTGVRPALAAALLRARGVTRAYNLGGAERDPLASYL